MQKMKERRTKYEEKRKGHESKSEEKRKRREAKYEAKHAALEKLMNEGALKGSNKISAPWD